MLWFLLNLEVIGVRVQILLLAYSTATASKDFFDPITPNVCWGKASTAKIFLWYVRHDFFVSCPSLSH